MAPTAAQFSPGQILDAGRRAENDGRVGYAIQFYRHLTDHHSHSPEAAIAKEALTRLSNFRPTGETTLGNAAPAQPMPQHHGVPPTAPPQNWAQPQQGLVNVARPGPPPSQLAHGHAPVQSHRAGNYTQTATIPDRPLRLPAPERRYRIGSVVAWLVFVIGLIVMVAGVTFLVLHAIGLKMPGMLGTMLGFTGGMPGALAIIVVGVTQVFAAQIGRALFDSANATRDLAMIERSKIAHAAGDHGSSDDDEPA